MDKGRCLTEKLNSKSKIHLINRNKIIEREIEFYEELHASLIPEKKGKLQLYVYHL